MRIIEYYDRLSNQWYEIKFNDLKDGDIFRIIDNGVRYYDPITFNNVWIVKGDVFVDEDGIFTVETVY